MPTTEKRPVANFNRISLKGYGDIILTQGETESLSIETEPGTLEKLRSEVRSGTLVLEFTSWWNWVFASRPPIKYYITVRQLDFGSAMLPSAALAGYALLFFLMAVWRFRKVSE